MAIGAAVTVLIVGCVVMLGWVIGSVRIVQLHSSWESMKFNTALGFAVFGASTALLVLRFRRAALWCALAIVVTALATLAQFALGVDLRIDELIVSDFTSTAYPGRMSPITGGLFVLSGSALALLSAWTQRTRVAGVLASIVAGIALSAVIGYATQTPTAYGWGAVTSMAAHTAASFLIAAVALGAMAAGINDQHWPDWLPWAALIAGLACTMALGAALHYESPHKPLSLVPEIVVAIGATTSGLMALVLRARDRLAAQRDLLARALRQREEALASQVILDQRLRESLQEKELLLKEVHHRVKNNLQVVASMLTLQSYRTDEPEIRELLANCRKRVISMAMVHEKLYGAGDLRQVDLGELVRGIATMLMTDERGFDLTVDLDLEKIVVDIEKAFPASLLVNELILNALKHAFVGRSQGRLHIGLHRMQGAIQLRVADDGVGGLEADFLSRSDTLGATIIRSLATQLNGELRVQSEQGRGTDVCVLFGAT